MAPYITKSKVNGKVAWITLSAAKGLAMEWEAPSNMVGIVMQVNGAGKDWYLIYSIHLPSYALNLIPTFLQFNSLSSKKQICQW